MPQPMEGWGYKILNYVPKPNKINVAKDENDVGT